MIQYNWRGIVSLSLGVLLASCSTGSGSLPPTRATVSTSTSQSSFNLRIATVGQRPGYHLILPRGPLPPAATAPPFSDPTATARRQVFVNPPADLVKTAEFIAMRRLHGSPGMTATRSSQSVAEKSPSNLAIGVQQHGVYIYQQSGVLGLYGTHSAYDPVMFVSYSGADITETLYAPTGKPANGCVEVGTRNTPGAADAEIYAFDFCDGKGGIGTFFPMLSMLASNVTDYVRSINGVPSYTFETLKNPDGRWTAYLYNFAKGYFQEKYTSTTANYNSGYDLGQQSETWDMFEPKYPVHGICMGTPPVVSSNLTLLTSSGWTSFNNITAATDDAYLSRSCFSGDDGSGLGDYYFFAVSDKADWSVFGFANDEANPPPESGCGRVSLNCCDDYESCCDEYGGCVACQFDNVCVCDGFTSGPLGCNPGPCSMHARKAALQRPQRRRCEDELWLGRVPSDDLYEKPEGIAGSRRKPVIAAIAAMSHWHPSVSAVRYDIDEPRPGKGVRCSRAEGVLSSSSAFSGGLASPGWVLWMLWVLVRRPTIAPLRLSAA